MQFLFREYLITPSKKTGHKELRRSLQVPITGLIALLVVPLTDHIGL